MIFNVIGRVRIFTHHPHCYVTKQYISIFPVSPIRCIGCNRSNSRHLATELVDMWSLKNGQEINRTKGTRVDYIQVRRRGFT